MGEIKARGLPERKSGSGSIRRNLCKVEPDLGFITSCSISLFVVSKSSNDSHLESDGNSGNFSSHSQPHNKTIKKEIYDEKEKEM
jgi:hypothetical protein